MISDGGGEVRTGAPPLTVGVALPIPSPFGAELGAFRERFGDQWAHAIVAHITLVPPHPLGSPGGLGAVEEHLARCAGSLRPFPIELAGSQSFRPVSPVVFVPLVVGERQVREVESRLRTGPLDLRLQFPFHPHVTVAQDVGDERLDAAERELATYRARFVASGFSLFARGTDGVWHAIRDFPFGT